MTVRVVFRIGDTSTDVEMDEGSVLHHDRLSCSPFEEVPRKVLAIARKVVAMIRMAHDELLDVHHGHFPPWSAAGVLCIDEMRVNMVIRTVLTDPSTFFLILAGDEFDTSA